MLHVFVCEDTDKQRRDITDIIEKAILIENYDMRLVLSSGNPHDILAYVGENRTMGVYFLDVELNCDINGILLAQKIREYDPRGFIIFITSHAELLHLTFQYKVEAMEYLLKDDISALQSKIKDCLVYANANYTTPAQTSRKALMIKYYDTKRVIDYDQLLYIESDLYTHKVIVHAVRQDFDFYSTLREIEKSLDERFIRCHKRFIVNTDMIEAIGSAKGKLSLKYGASCPVSTRWAKKIAQMGVFQDSSCF